MAFKRSFRSRALFVNETSRRAQRVRQMEVDLLWMRVSRKSRGPRRSPPTPLATARPPSLQTTVLVCSSPKLLGVLWAWDPPAAPQSPPAASPGFPFRQRRGHEQAKPLHYNTASQEARGLLSPRGLLACLSLSSLRRLPQEPALRRGQGGMERPGQGLCALERVLQSEPQLP